jgi:oligopeptide/dipeptide ABC transporter ATP-binding protein
MTDANGRRVPVPGAVLRVENLHTYYFTHSGIVRALRGVDLVLDAGTVLGLVGESGSGKTTLARSIMGLPAPPGRIVEGRILFGTRDLRMLAPREWQTVRAREIAMIVPNPRGELDPLLPVGEQLVSVIRAHTNMRGQDAKELALEMLRAVQIPDPKRRFGAYPHELSGGMAQRVVIAIALSCSPRIVISDDATSGLDVTVQAQILSLLRDLIRGRKSSMILITRDLGIVAHMSDRLAIMYAGEIVEMATTLEFFSHPAHPYSMMLLSAFTHDRALRARWRKEGEGPELTRPPRGCPYASRCVRAQARCLNGQVPLVEVATGHFVRCHYPL